MADIEELLRRYSSPDAVRSPATDLSYRRSSPDDMRSHTPAWYDQVTNALTDILYGEHANTRNRAMVGMITGPENPFNLPANATEGFGRASSGLNNGDYRTAAMGALQMAGAMPLAAALARSSRGALPRNAGTAAPANTTPSPAINPLDSARRSPYWPSWGDAYPERAMAHVAEQEAFAPWNALVQKNQWNGNLPLMDTAQAEAKAMQSNPELGRAYEKARRDWVAQDAGPMPLFDGRLFK